MFKQGGTRGSNVRRRIRTWGLHRTFEEEEDESGRGALFPMGRSSALALAFRNILQKHFLGRFRDLAARSNRIESYLSLRIFGRLSIHHGRGAFLLEYYLCALWQASKKAGTTNLLCVLFHLGPMEPDVLRLWEILLAT